MPGCTAEPSCLECGVNEMLASACRRLAFGLMGGVVVLAPWFYGAWEMWGFWPFVVVLCLVMALLGVGWLLAPAVAASSFALGACERLALAFIPFLAYAVGRACFGVVWMDAERTVLLFVTPLLVGVVSQWGGTPAARRLLLGLIAVDLACLAVYGFANHLLTGSRYVLSAPGFSQYYLDNRVTGTYFCPDHFSGIMEIAFCIGLAFVVRGVGWGARGCGALLMGLGALLRDALRAPSGEVAVDARVWPRTLRAQFPGARLCSSDVAAN